MGCFNLFCLFNEVVMKVPSNSVFNPDDRFISNKDQSKINQITAQKPTVVSKTADVGNKIIVSNEPFLDLNHNDYKKFSAKPKGENTIPKDLRDEILFESADDVVSESGEDNVFDNFSEEIKENEDLNEEVSTESEQTAIESQQTSDEINETSDESAKKLIKLNEKTNEIQAIAAQAKSEAKLSRNAPILIGHDNDGSPVYQEVQATATQTLFDKLKHKDLNNRDKTKVAEGVAKGRALMKKKEGCLAVEQSISDKSKVGIIVPPDWSGDLKKINKYNLPPGAKRVPLVAMNETDKQELQKLIIDYLTCSIKLYQIQNIIQPTKSQSADKENTDKASLEKRDEGVNIRPRSVRKAEKQSEESKNEYTKTSSDSQYHHEISDEIAQNARNQKQALKLKEIKDKKENDHKNHLLESKDLNNERIIEMNNICKQKIYNLGQIRNVSLELNKRLENEFILKEKEIKTMINTVIKENIKYEDEKFISVVINIYNPLLKDGKEKVLLVKLGRIIKSFGPAL
jgi:hypothetical protein